MLPREQFVRAIDNIRAQEKRVSEFNEALNKICDGFPVYDVNNRYLAGLLDILKYTMDDKYDYISWWLYEAPNAGYTIYWTENGKEVSCDLEDINVFYDYLVSEAENRQGGKS
jgi:hypothetical protein